MTIEQHPKWNRQVELEQEMRGIGFSRIERNIEAAKAGERESETCYGQHILKWVIDPMAERIRTFIRESCSGKPGRRALAAKYLVQLRPENAAFLIAKTVFDTMSQDKMLQDVAIRVGQAIEEEVRLAFSRQENPALFDTMVKDHKKRKVTPGWSQRVILGRMRQAGVKWEAWPKTDCLHLGIKGIEILMESMDPPLLALRRGPAARGKRPALYLHMTPEAGALIERRSELSALLTPGFLPTVVPPKPWAGPTGGAYWTDAIDDRVKRLVKTTNMAYLEDLRHTEMPKVYTAVNAIQNTAWRVNTRVLDVLGEAWDARMELGKLPPRDDLPFPSKPHDIDTNRAARKVWKRTVFRLREANHRLMSKRFQVAKTIWVANMFRDEAAIYFPYQLDFRGRVYAMPMFLNPQGPDYAKALLTFAHGAPIGNETAARWLAIHGANTWGYDKASMDERVTWVQEHEAQILRAAEDPLGYRWWADADKPWQFLAWCFEWAGFKREGYGFVSSLPIALDGTCNGLQHFSAMLRDEIGGAAVNLVPADKPQDIYQRVADRVIELLKAETGERYVAATTKRAARARREATKAAEALAKLQKSRRASESDVQKAQAQADRLAEVATAAEQRAASAQADTRRWVEQWLAYGIDRKITKRPVMVLPYGGTLHACRKYVMAHILEQAEVGHPHPFGEAVVPAVTFLSSIIWAAIGDVVVAAREAMAWLQKLARLVSGDGMPLLWRTPAGFPVRQAYPELSSRQVMLMLSGKIIRRRINDELDTINLNKQVRAISPNFVHSLDAAALMLCVGRSVEQGITNFAMVHDSYGTIAAQTDALGRTLREAFVDMYQQHDVLRDFLASTTSGYTGEEPIPPMPKSGSLNIDAVLESEFFFA